MSDSKGELWDSPTYTYAPFTATIMKALSNHDVTGSLIGIETYNTAGIDRMNNHYANIFGEHLEIQRWAANFLASTFTRLTNTA